MCRSGPRRQAREGWLGNDGREWHVMIGAREVTGPWQR